MDGDGAGRPSKFWPESAQGPAKIGFSGGCNNDCLLLMIRAKTIDEVFVFFFCLLRLAGSCKTGPSHLTHARFYLIVTVQIRHKLVHGQDHKFISIMETLDN